ncbi:MAG TPA: alpha/beta fold hydrolase [Balneolaceae bacterium]|nr:alpha/beta fold hydrolase [Balneolaceae bacterium]
MIDLKNISKTTGAVDSTEGLPIRFDVYWPDDETPADLPTILFLHGFKGFKNWGTFPAVCQRLSAAGFAVVAMNFSLNGIGENPLEFDRLDLFARETFSQDLDDIGSVLEGLHQTEITAGGQPLDPGKAGVLGHSRGGQTAIAAAAEYAQIQCLVTWSAVADYNARWNPAMIDDWENEGVTYIKNGRTGQLMPMKKVVYDDARENADRVIALNRISELKCPALFIHSKGDEAVPYQDAQKLYETCPSTEKDLLLLDDSGHTFGGSHPFKEDKFPKPLQKAFSTSKNWFKTHLK